ncbi:MAG: hypothetical protein JRJ60_09535 [Deltaproteobacteria bacterium]|nr:hypothetical protein [Deltaproteobacteria bacterium]
MKKLIGAALIILLTFSFGCVGRVAKPVEKPIEPPRTPREPLVSMVYLDEKIRRLETTAENRSLSEQQRETAVRLIQSYGLIRNTVAPPPQEAEDRKIIDEFTRSLSMLEKQYFSVMPLESPGTPTPGPLSNYLEKRNAALEAYLRKDYEAVIRLTRESASDYGPEAVTGNAGLAYVLSLAHQDMIEEAIAVAKKLETQRERGPDRVLLQTKIAEWQLELGLRDKAETTYKGLSRSLDDQRGFVDALGRKIDEAPVEASPGQETMPQPLDRRPQSDDMARLQARVDECLRDSRFESARQVLIAARKDASSTADILAIDRALADVDASEERYLTERIALITKKKDALDIAGKLIEEEKYEQAITSLEALENEQGQGLEIKALKAQAMEKHIHEERNRAARLYLLARRTKDAEKQAEYLRQSRDILKNIDEKYPLSNYNKKVKSNLKVVENEMERLGVE